MITFRISFLLAFYLTPPILKNEDPKHDTKSQKSSKSSQVSDKAKKSTESLPGRKRRSAKYEETSSLTPEYVLDTGSPIGYAHIEYELIPGKPKQVIDVVCWNKVAKVFVDEETLTFKCKVVDEKIWVPIFIQHYVNSLETNALVDFHKHSINFLIFTNKQKLDARAKSENTKKFYIRQEHVQTGDIVFAYTEDPNVGDSKITKRKTILEEIMHEIITDCIYKPGFKNEDDISTRLKCKDQVHTFRMREIISKSCIGKYMCFKEYIPISLAPSSEDEKVKEFEEKTKFVKNGKESQKERAQERKMKEQKSGGPLQIKVNSEVFFTNPTFSSFDLKQSNNIISKGFVLLSVDHLMTTKQKYELNPLVIRINKINNLPAEVLKAHNFKSVFVQYNVPHIAQIKTMEKDIGNQVRINEAHAHFTNEISNIQFSEFMTAKRLCVEICGVLDDSPQYTKGSLFGSQESDKLLWKRLTPHVKNTTLEESRVVVLAVACYDLSSLVMPTWDVLFNESCHNPDNLLFQKPGNPYACNKFENITPANINLKTWCKKRSASPLTELILNQHNTCLKVEAFLSAPTVHIMRDVRTSSCFYTRMFLTLFDMNLAMSFLNELLLRNQHLNQEVVSKSPVQRTRKNETVKSEWITGFVIDNCEEFSFFIEGLEGNVEIFWKTFSNKSNDEVRIFHNSTSKFEKRLYADFLPIGGIYVITLHKPLQDILTLQGIYIEGNVPLPCWQALRKLDLLYRCCTSKDMLQFSLFPTPEELYSLDLELGIPLRWKENIQRHARRMTLLEVFS